MVVGKGVAYGESGRGAVPSFQGKQVEPKIFGLIETAGLAYRGNGANPAITTPGALRDDIIVKLIDFQDLPTEMRCSYEGFEETVDTIHVEYETHGPVYAITLKTGTRERWTLTTSGWMLRRSIR